MTIGETNGSTVKKLAAILCSDPNINNVQHFQGTLLNIHMFSDASKSLFLFFFLCTFRSQHYWEVWLSMAPQIGDQDSQDESR